jgi:hypothetical protein
MRVKNTAGHLVQYMLLATKGEGVASIGATLEAGYGIVGGRKHVHDFAFSFVAPLEAY